MTPFSSRLCVRIHRDRLLKPDAGLIFSQSELVVLRCQIKEDRKGGYVGGLAGKASECSRTGGLGQSASSTVRTRGRRRLLIDASGSIAPNRDMVIAASMAFSKAMNPQDEFFVLGFNEDIHTPLPADKPFTNFEPTLRVALVQAIKSRGQTASYDALNAGLEYVQKGGFERQVLIVLSGGDNANQHARAGHRERVGLERRDLYDCARGSDGFGSRSRVP
jgi:hypothetical protein